MLYSNNSVVSFEDIGVGDNALYCITDRESCCSDADGGDWILPGQSSIIGESGDVPSGDFSTSRGRNAVLLNRRNEVTGPTGLFTCRVLDSRGVIQSLYIGVYGVTGGMIMIIERPQIWTVANVDVLRGFYVIMHLRLLHGAKLVLFLFAGIPALASDITYSILTHTLTCISTGGPVTNISWAKNGILIALPSLSYTWSQTVLNTATTTYHNLLTISSTAIKDYSGNFSCEVSNIRGGSTDAIQISCKNFALLWQFYT